MKRFVLFALVLAAGCARPVERVVGIPGGTLRAEATGNQDTTPKADLRMVPPEAYMRTYLELFGELAPLDAQKKARGADGNNLFDTWNDYVSALGFPDYALDIPRQTQTNALMVATFERLGIALCDRAVERDLAMLGKPVPPPKATPPKPDPKKKPEPPKKGEKAEPPKKPEPAKPEPVVPAILPVGQRIVFAFEPKANMTEADFAERFDVLHRTFLGYPASLAPAERAPRFYGLYVDITKSHAKESPKSKLTPDQAGWAAVCYGLVRHPEFHLY